ncbi:undecaprenyldiphospho-muramoylpentapeptide beta-N-acetylglucosaminyltransferase [soil metagenome]
MQNSRNDRLRVVVAAGGTGGHIFPAVAVVEQLREQTQGACDVVFLGSMDRMETTLIPALGYDYVGMPIVGFKGVRHASTLTLPWKILQSTRIARATIRRFKPHAVICTGAYISFPAGLAASREGIPLFLLESNVNPGKTNARLAPLATAIFLSFNESVRYYAPSLASKLVVTGNPVRSQIPSMKDAREAREAWGLKPDVPTVLVFGGSLGARAINAAIEAALPRLAAAPFQVIWQTGASYTFNAEAPPNVVIRAFIDDMGAAYAAADLVVSRSGATTIAELGIVGKPAVFVPLPSASTGEQQHNAQVIADAGGAVVVKDADVLTILVSTIEELMQHEEQRMKMADVMRSFGRPRAAADAAAAIMLMSTNRGPR